MGESVARATLAERLRDLVGADPRIAGLVDYGSATGLDDWSDIDVGVFLRDVEVDGFLLDRTAWLARLGAVVLRHDGVISGHPYTRTVYDLAPVPLRVDAVFYQEAEVGSAFRWPDVPTAARVAIWCDRTDGRLTSAMGALEQQSLRPADLPEAFREVSDALWYALLDTSCKLERGDQWGVRLLFHGTVIPELIRLLRLEAGAVNRWYGTPTAKGIDGALSPERRAHLHACIPDVTLASIRQSLRTATELATDVSMLLAARYATPWPEALAGHIMALLTRSATARNG